jgi:hypothetical protein
MFHNLIESGSHRPDLARRAGVITYNFTLR